jgi:hypothetical protein
MLAAASYISLTADETSAIDNCSYIVIHVYMLQDWVRVPLVLHLQKLESGNDFGLPLLYHFCSLNQVEDAHAW